MNNSLYYVFILFVSACGKGAGPEPKSAEVQLVTSSVESKATDAPEVVTPKESGRALRYEFVFSDAKSTLSICTDGPFAVIDQQWSTQEGAGSKHWGADSARLIFDSGNKVLTVINQTKNTFVRVDAERMAEAEADLERGTPISLGNLGAAPSSGPMQPAALPAPLAVPIPSKNPKKKHPSGCSVFERDLPKGLKEETCFETPTEDVVVSEAFAPLIGLANFVSVLEERVRDLETVIAVANALDWDTGIPTAQFKFGDSPFEEDNAAMEVWDRTFTLKSRSTCSVLPVDLEPPADAVKEFGILPWNTPFIVTALPK